MRNSITRHWNSLASFLTVLVTICSGSWLYRERAYHRNPPCEEIVLPIYTHTITDVFRETDVIAENRRREEQRRVQEGRILNEVDHRPEVLHQHFLMTFPRAVEFDIIAEQFEDASKIIISRENRPPDEIIQELRQRQLPDEITRDCRQRLRSDNNCVSSKYRSFDGSCNNLLNPDWGRTFTCLRRILPPQYADGLSAPRTGVDGPLPGARDVSVSVHRQIHSEPSKSYTHMLMTWGQFLDHDITLTPLSRTVDNQLIQCCPIRRDTNEQCFPIVVRNDDYFYSQFGRTCLNFVRSARCPLCLLGPREQTNQLTAFVDASQVYGTSLNENNQLRAHSGGKMLMISHPVGGQLLPPSANPNSDTCSIPSQNLSCFRAGDVRLNQNHGLASMHTIWAREHNRIADILQFLHSDWEDEKLYQETRRIVAAEMQIVTWGEFLPVVLGEEYMDFYYLNVQTDGYTRYLPSTDPSLFNEFVAAAFRFGHSLIDGTFDVINFKGDDCSLRLRDNFFSPFELYDGFLDGLVRGGCHQPAQKFDTYLVEDVTNHLHQRRGNVSGIDLPASNIQRGRDHGLPGYTAYLSRLFDMTVSTFDDLRELIRPNELELLRKIYSSVHDIDLFTGGTAEIPVKGGIVGKVFASIIGKQFFRLKHGDRFYFEHFGQEGSFTEDQLRQLRKVTLSRILCDNTNIRNVQRKVFSPPSFQNPVLPCSKLPMMHLDSVF